MILILTYVVKVMTLNDLQQVLGVDRCSLKSYLKSLKNDVSSIIYKTEML